MLWKAVFFVLGEDQIAVDDNVKDPARTFDEFGLDAELALDCIRQTGGLGQVVSHATVFNADLHAGDSERIAHAPTATRPGAPMCSTIASAKAEHFSSVAPSMRRSKS